MRMSLSLIVVAVRIALQLMIVSSSAADMTTSSIRSFKMSSGYEIPIVGLGTFTITPEQADDAITTALDNGYRHIDTAFIYKNEEAIGKALKKWFDKGGKREELFITTKLLFETENPDTIESIIKFQLKNLGLDYVDLYLIHAPRFVGPKNIGRFTPTVNENDTSKTNSNPDFVVFWKALEVQVKAGRIRSIGISNFNESEIQRIIDNAEIKPSNLQNEIHAYRQEKSLREFCKKNNITVTGYGNLGAPGTKNDKIKAIGVPKLLENPVVQKIAANHNKTTAQVLLRHLVQSDVIVIPKSIHPERIKSNNDIFDFELNKDEMKEMDSLDLGDKVQLYG